MLIAFLERSIICAICSYFFSVYEIIENFFPLKGVENTAEWNNTANWAAYLKFKSSQATLQQ